MESLSLYIYMYIYSLVDEVILSGCWFDNIYNMYHKCIQKQYVYYICIQYIYIKIYLYSRI